MYLVTFASLVACVVSVFSLGVFWCFAVDAATEPCWGSLPLILFMLYEIKGSIHNKTPQARTQTQHTQPGTQRLQGTSNTTYNIKHKRIHINDVAR